MQGGSRALHERAHRLVVTGTAVPDHSGGGEGGGEDAGKGGDGALFTHPLLRYCFGWSEGREDGGPTGRGGGRDKNSFKKRWTVSAPLNSVQPHGNNASLFEPSGDRWLKSA